MCYLSTLICPLGPRCSRPRLYSRVPSFHPVARVGVPVQEPRQPHQPSTTSAARFLIKQRNELVYLGLSGKGADVLPVSPGGRPSRPRPASPSPSPFTFPCRTSPDLLAWSLVILGLQLPGRCVCRVKRIRGLGRVESAYKGMCVSTRACNPTDHDWLRCREIYSLLGKIVVCEGYMNRQEALD